jgi:ATP-dependent DNA helicase RecG
MNPPTNTLPAHPLTGPQKALRKLGLERAIDVALHLPLRYEDETRLVKLRDVREGDMAQVEGTVVHSEIKLSGTRQLIVTLDDGMDTCRLRFFTFYPAMQKALTVGNQIRVRGEIKGGYSGLTMMHPAFKPAGGELATTLTPVYPTTAGLPQAYLRKVVDAGLKRADLSETIPEEFIHEIGLKALWSLREALLFLHYPPPDQTLLSLQDRSHPAWQRIKAEELLAQQLSQLQARRERSGLHAPALMPLQASSKDKPLLHERLLASLPFVLTAAQRRVCEEIICDLQQPVPMHRLLQGDVGSGKTVVAALAAAVCMDAGWQCALMAPTEILATQHFAKLVGWLHPLGITVAWLTGSQKTKERHEMLALIASGQAQLVVGTHAIIQDKVQFKNMALAIIDEQHRFGVAQRLALHNKLVPPEDVLPDASGHDAPATFQKPHVLMMTATPIPRTLAMSYYADLNVSTIDELPPGRTPVMTKVIHEARRDEVIDRIRLQLTNGRQIYWVCPLIEESEALDLSNATQTHAMLSDALPGVVVGLLHSRMSAGEKKAVMGLFVSGQMGLLVSTTVIEVGVDVPNASLMVIEHAERFGLSQLHQLRGRVGRGTAASACVLLYSTGDAPRLGQTARERLKAMMESHDGFEIARRDLEIRGPGEFMGARQSGASMLRFADLTEDVTLLEWARGVADKMIERFPDLAEKHVQRWLSNKADFLKA